MRHQISRVHCQGIHYCAITIFWLVVHTGIWQLVISFRAGNWIASIHLLYCIHTFSVKCPQTLLQHKPSDEWPLHSPSPTAMIVNDNNLGHHRAVRYVNWKSLYNTYCLFSYHDRDFFLQMLFGAVIIETNYESYSRYKAKVYASNQAAM